MAANTMTSRDRRAGANTATVGLLVRIEAKAASDDAVEALLLGALPMVEAEPDTTAWFAVRFGRNEYGIVDFFPNEAGRVEHLQGPVARALTDNVDILFTKPPTIEKLVVLAERLPSPGADTGSSITKGLLLTFAAKAGREGDVEEFLRGSKLLVDEEPRTTAWFAMLFEKGRYGIFDVFPDNGARFAHLTGLVPRELAKHAATLLRGVPDMSMLDVLATKLPH
jgi:hypothetical protein